METLYLSIQERRIGEGCEMENEELEDSSLLLRLFIDFFWPPCK